MNFRLPAFCLLIALVLSGCSGAARSAASIPTPAADVTQAAGRVLETAADLERALAAEPSQAEALNADLRYRLAKAEEARQRAHARLEEKLSDDQVASVNSSLARSLAQLRVKRRHQR